MKLKLILFSCLSLILLSAVFFQLGECGKKKKLLKAAKYLLLGAALSKSKKFIPIPIPLPIPIKTEKHFVHSKPYPVHVPYPEPVFIHESYDSYGGYHDNGW